MARETRTREESRFAVLRYLARRWTNGPKNNFDGPIEHTQPQIAEALGVVRSAVVGTLDELVISDLVVCHRLRTGNDRRRKVYFITPAGMDVLKDADERRP